MRLFLTTLFILCSAMAQVGDSNVELTVCMSKSKRTTLVYKSDLSGGDIEAEVYFSIDTNMLHTVSSRSCNENPAYDCNFVKMKGKGSLLAPKKKWSLKLFSLTPQKQWFSKPRQIQELTNRLDMTST